MLEIVFPIEKVFSGRLNLFSARLNPFSACLNLFSGRLNLFSPRLKVKGGFKLLWRGSFYVSAGWKEYILPRRAQRDAAQRTTKRCLFIPYCCLSLCALWLGYRCAGSVLR